MRGAQAGSTYFEDRCHGITNLHQASSAAGSYGSPLNLCMYERLAISVGDSVLNVQQVRGCSRSPLLHREALIIAGL